MNWRNYFSSTILQRGKTYYNRNLVEDLELVNEKYHACVQGTFTYNVTVWRKANGQLGMSCDCPHARDGNRCKHMAAVCFALNEELTKGLPFAHTGTKKENLNAEVKPFKLKNSSESMEYTYFDLAVMTKDIVITENQLKKAKKLIENNMIVLDHVDIYYAYSYEKGMVLQGNVQGRVKDKSGWYYDVEIRFDADAIQHARCYLRSCNHYYEVRSSYYSSTLCVHELAMLLLLEQYIEKYNPGDGTDYDGMCLLDNYKTRQRQRIVGDSGEAIEDLLLEPRIEKIGNNMKVSFRVGSNRLYVIKNLVEFVNKVEAGETQTFGKKTEMHYGIHKFHETSKPYYDFIKKIISRDELKHRTKYPWNNYDETVTIPNLELNGEVLDEFFEILLESKQKVPYQDYLIADKKATIQARDHILKLEMNIEPRFEKQNIFSGVHVSGDIPEMIEGEQAYYYVELPYLNRFKRDVVKEIVPFIDREEHGKIEFVVGRKSLSDFYYHVMPVVSDFITFKEEKKELYQSYIPPKVEFQFYLDVDERQISCDAKALYGEKSYSLIDHFKNENNIAIYRDRESEAEAMYHVQRYFPEIDDTKDVFLCNEEEESAFAVLEKGLYELMGIGTVFCTERLKAVRIRKKTPVSVGISLRSGMMDLEISSEEFSREELMEILGSYRKKKKYHRLKNGDFLSMEDNNLGMLSDMLESLRIKDKDFIKGNMKIPAFRALYLDHTLEKNESFYVERDKNFKSLIKEFKTVSDSDFEVPYSLKNILRNYQNTGYKWLRTLSAYGFGGILADDMGLGKTLQVISVLLAVKQEGQKDTSLIIAPASLIYNWKDEFERFAPELKVQIIGGTQKERIEQLKTYEQQDVIITSYDLLKRDIAEYEEKKFGYQIIDEAQYIKNHSTAVAKAVKCITSKTRYALTGTPIENRLSELWSIFDYLMPGFLYGYETFRKELERPITKNQDEDATKRLKRMVSPFILRRLKEDVLKDLPDKLEEIQYGGFDTKQQKLYDGQVVHMREILANQNNEDFKKNKIQILAELTKLRQICCDPSLLFENYDGYSAKREMCIDLVKRAIEGEHRILLFSQFTSMLTLIEQDLKEENIEYYKITGSTPKEERISLVKQFNEGTVPIFLISLKAGGTGLNLTGADVVIHYDPWWNLAVQNQATDRAHRIGQQKVVTVYKLIMKGTIEEKIVKLQEKKKNLADEILSGEQGGLSKLTKEELLELL